MSTAWLVRLFAAVAFALTFAVAGPGVAFADDGGEALHDGGAGSDGEDDSDHDLARDLVERGEIHTLQDIVAVLATAVPGRIIGVRLARDSDRWVYSFRIVTAGGNRIRVKVDAASLSILDTEQQ